MTPVYKQSDKRWASEIVGFGTRGQNFGNVGCTVCALTYLLNSKFGYDLTPDQVNDRLKYVKAFVGASLYWGRVQLAFPQLKFAFRDYNYSNPLVWAWINVNPRLPVFVEVLKSDSSTGKHWVLYLGGQKMYDSIRGEIISTSTPGYKVATGSARYSRA